MSLHECSLCKDPLHEADGHNECVACLGVSHEEAALTEASCSHCDNMNLAHLRSRITFFHGGSPLRFVLPTPFSLNRKQQQHRWPIFSGSSDVVSAQHPYTSVSPQHFMSLVCYASEDQWPPSDASGLVSFCASEEEVVVDDSMSLMASDADE